jgi:uncharacterized membrane protein YsdA (DUF1294 family)
LAISVATSEFVWQRFLVLSGVSIVSSAVAFILYGVDKAASQKSSRRVSENTLHLWALLGGWPGALAGQRVFRHKTRKLSFQIVFWGTVVLNCAAVAWVLSPRGDQVFSRLIENGGQSSELPQVTPRSRSDR